jgi:hypothetical protein
MKPIAVPSSSSRRGAALLMSMLVLLVLAALVFQIAITTQTDARVARNDITLTTMDLVCESALLEVGDRLKTDADAGGGADPAAAAANPAAAVDPNAAQNPAAATGGAPSQEQQAVDSRRDEWAMPQRTEINEIKLRIFIQDEDSKYNVLNMVNPDEREAEAAFGRVSRILDLCREGTLADIPAARAEEMARSMRDHMTKRRLSPFPRPKLLTDVEKDEDNALPTSLREFLAISPFDESDFRDFRDEDGKVVHSIETFLTVWSSLQSAAELQNGKAPAAQPQQQPNAQQPQGNTGSKAGTSTPAPSAANPTAAATIKSDTNGYSVNVNTAPAAVLKALFDDRELHPAFWDKVVEYRNLEEEEEEGADAKAEEQDPDDAPLDEYGQPILKRRIFEQVSELQKVDGWDRLVPAIQDKVTQLCTTQSHVFTVYIVARKATSVEGDLSDVPRSAEEKRAEEERGDSLMRVVRSVVWRAKKGDELIVMPIVRWEVLDYYPHEVVDYPDEQR